MTDVGLDYAWQKPPVESIVAAGYRFVSRYLSYDTTGKNITPGELHQLLAAGIEVGLNWEWQATDMLGGSSAGLQHGQEAVRQAQALGYPKGCCITFSGDFDATEAQQQLINAYMGNATAMCHNAGYRSGIYGGYWVVKRTLDARVCDDGWQTYAWSGGQWDPRAAVRQDQNGITVGGADCDHNTRVGRTYFMGGQSTVEEDMGWGFMKYGDQGDNIRYLQHQLRDAGAAIDVTGAYDNPTAKAVVDLGLAGGDPSGHTFGDTEQIRLDGMRMDRRVAAAAGGGSGAIPAGTRFTAVTE